MYYRRIYVEKNLDYHLNENFPQVCVSSVESEECFFNKSIPSYSLNLWFDDFNHVAQTSLFNISYEINLYDTCGNKYNETIKLNEIFRKTDLPSGNYFIEIIPRLETTYCKDQCPVFVSKNGQFENEILCEECKKIVQLIQIKKINHLECHRELHSRLEFSNNAEFLIESFVSNKTLIFNQNVKFIAPMDSHQICNKMLAIRCQKISDSLQATIAVISILILITIVIVFVVISCKKYSNSNFL